MAPALAVLLLVPLAAIVATTPVLLTLGRLLLLPLPVFALRRLLLYRLRLPLLVLIALIEALLTVRLWRTLLLHGLLPLAIAVLLHRELTARARVAILVSRPVVGVAARVARVIAPRSIRRVGRAAVTSPVMPVAHRYIADRVRDRLVADEVKRPVVVVGPIPAAVPVVVPVVAVAIEIVVVIIDVIDARAWNEHDVRLFIECELRADVRVADAQAEREARRRGHLRSRCKQKS